MATYKMTIAGAAEWHRRLAKNFWPTVLKGAKLGAYRGVAELQNTSMREALDRSAYARGWRFSVSDRTIIIYNPVKYAGVIEDGRRAGEKMPPPAALEAWVRRHLNVEYITKKGVAKARKVRKDEAPGLAFIVARAIGKRGIKGKHILARANDRIAYNLEAEICSALDKELNRQL